MAGSRAAAEDQNQTGTFVEKVKRVFTGKPDPYTETTEKRPTTEQVRKGGKSMKAAENVADN